jgi:hypothetical protein
VKRYVELDHKGARLDAMSIESVASYTGWNEEPAWGHVVVRSSRLIAAVSDGCWTLHLRAARVKWRSSQTARK